MNPVSDVPYFVRTCPGQVGIGDRRVYFQAAKSLQPGGVMIDSGTLAGATSVSLAVGAVFSDAPLDRKIIHSFDMFRCDWETPKFFQNAFGGEWKEGDSFRHIYDSVTAPFSRFIDVHEGDLLGYEEWTGQPIDVLGVDVWKTEALALHMMRVFFPYLRVGSLVLQQDYRTIWLPWIHTLMEAMHGHFERTYECPDHQGGTVVFTLTKPISGRDVERAIEQYMDRNERAALVDNAVHASHLESTGIFVRLANTVSLASLGDKAAAADWLRSVAVPETNPLNDHFSTLRGYLQTYVERIGA